MNNGLSGKEIKSDLLNLYQKSEKILFKIFEDEKDFLVKNDKNNANKNKNNINTNNIDINKYDIKEILIIFLQNSNKVSFSNKENFFKFGKFIKVTHKIRTFEAHNYDELSTMNNFLQCFSALKEGFMFIDSLNKKYVKSRYLDFITTLQKKYKIENKDIKIDFVNGNLYKPEDKIDINIESLDINNSKKTSFPEVSNFDNFEQLSDQLNDYYINKYKKVYDYK